MTSTEYTIDGKTLSYEIFDNGYDIFVDGNLSYTQRKPYIPYPNLSYQENAIRQIMRIAGVEEPTPEPQPTQLDTIEENQLIIMEAMADQYEQSVETELTNMEVMATIYEQLLAMEGVE